MTPKSPNRKAFFPGSFNPFTRGHQSIVSRALSIFDSVVIAFGVNCDKADSGTAAANIRAVKELYRNRDDVEVISYSGLTVDAAKENGAGVILRGVRNISDFEYERDMADINRKISGIDTVILFSEPELGFISSSIVRELEHYGRDVSDMLPVNE